MIMAYLLRILTGKMLMKLLATDGAKSLILRFLTALAERSDNDIDNDIVSVIAELMEGDKKALKKRK